MLRLGKGTLLQLELILNGTSAGLTTSYRTTGAHRWCLCLPLQLQCRDLSGDQDFHWRGGDEDGGGDWAEAGAAEPEENKEVIATFTRLAASGASEFERLLAKSALHMYPYSGISFRLEIENLRCLRLGCYAAPDLSLKGSGWNSLDGENTDESYTHTPLLLAIFNRHYDAVCRLLQDGKHAH